MPPLLQQLYERYLKDGDCPTFVKEASRRYTVGTLEKLALSADPKARQAAVMALGFLGDYHSNPILGQLIRDGDPVVRSFAEQAIRRNWFRVGTEPEQRELLRLERLNLTSEFQTVVRRSTRLIESNPELAEAWHQRATAHFHLLRFTDSIKDGFQTLIRNPFHYPAAIELGNGFLEINDVYNAIESYKRALSIHPGLTFLRAQINFLKRGLDSHHP